VVIYLGIHLHPNVDSQCRESLEAITKLIAHEIAGTPNAKTSTIAIVASKEFLNMFFIHNEPGPKEMLHGNALENVMNKFHLSSSPNVQNIISSLRNMISSFWNNIKDGGELDWILDMKGCAKMEYFLRFSELPRFSLQISQ